MQLVHQYLLEGSWLPFLADWGQSASPQAQQSSILLAEQGQTAGAQAEMQIKKGKIFKTA